MVLDPPGAHPLPMTTNTTHTTLPRRLTRSRSDKMLGGVAGGLGEHFDADPMLFRVGFVLSTLLLSGAGLVAYLVLLAVVPKTGEEPGPGMPAPA
jgi:phage shock protein PspC (stress-responsive transcriptional regulator)